MAATNSSAGVMGDDQPAEPVGRRRGHRRRRARRRILAKVIIHNDLTALMGVVAMLQAYVVPWMVPKL
jgi:hypothetical protein